MDIKQIASDDSSEGTRAATSFSVTSAGGSLAVVTPVSDDSVRPKSGTSDSRKLIAIEEVVISSKQPSARKPKYRAMYTKRFLNAIHAEEAAAGKPLTKVDPSNIVEDPVEEKRKGTVVYSEKFLRALRGENETTAKRTVEPVVTVEDEPEAPTVIEGSLVASEEPKSRFECNKLRKTLAAVGFKEEPLTMVSQNRKNTFESQTQKPEEILTTDIVASEAEYMFGRRDPITEPISEQVMDMVNMASAVDFKTSSVVHEDVPDTHFKTRRNIVVAEMELEETKVELVKAEVKLVETQVELVDTELTLVETQVELVDTEGKPIEEIEVELMVTELDLVEINVKIVETEAELVENPLNEGSLQIRTPQEEAPTVIEGSLVASEESKSRLECNKLRKNLAAVGFEEKHELTMVSQNLKDTFESQSKSLEEILTSNIVASVAEYLFARRDPITEPISEQVMDIPTVNMASPVDFKRSSVVLEDVPDARIQTEMECAEIDENPSTKPCTPERILDDPIDPPPETSDTGPRGTHLGRIASLYVRIFVTEVLYPILFDFTFNPLRW